MQTVIYDIKIRIFWGDPLFGLGYPVGAHVGNMFLVTHSAAYFPFQIGQIASEGIGETAMFGTTNTLEKEAKSHIGVNSYFVTGVIDAPGTITFPSIQFDGSAPLVSFTAMIAPSPDWFTGVSGVSLIDPVSGKWIAHTTVPLWAYDAGYDYGSGFYNDPDFPEPILKPITFLTGPPLFSQYQKPMPIGELEIIRTH